MNTPPFSDLSTLSSAHNAIAGVDGEDVRQLYTTSWNALDIQPPPSIREILAAYRAKGDGDREMLLAMLQAKSAEDQRLASQAALRRTMLEITQAADTDALPDSPPVHYQRPGYAHAQLVAPQHPSPRLAHTNGSASYGTHHSQAHPNGHSYAMREAQLQRIERSPDVDVNGRPIGHNRKGSYQDGAGQPLEGTRQAVGHAPNYTSPRGREPPQTQYQAQDKDRRKRFKRTPSPQPQQVPGGGAASYATRARNTTGLAQSSSSSSGSGTLRLRDSPPNPAGGYPHPVYARAQQHGHGAPGPGSAAREYAAEHARATAAGDRRYSADAAPASSSVAYAPRRGGKRDREYDELDEDVEMDGSRPSPRLSRLAAMRSRTAHERSLSPLEDEEGVAGESKQLSVSPREEQRKDLQEGEAGEATAKTGKTANSKTVSPTQSNGSTPSTRSNAQKPDDKERWEAVLDGRRGTGSGTRSPNENVKEVEPAR